RASPLRSRSGPYCLQPRRRLRIEKALPVLHEVPRYRRLTPSLRMRAKAAAAAGLRTNPRFYADVRSRSALRPQVFGWKNLGGRFHFHELHRTVPAHELSDAPGA